MANFTLVADSTFKPFTYQELVTPIAHQQQVMDQLADEYDKLSSQADILEAMGKNDKDKKSGVYSQYQAYSNALREEADNLYRNGLNYDSRMRLSDLRRRYNKEIVPIQNAWNERKQEADTQMKARLQNPSLRFTRDAANSSLEEYINNPMGGYGVVDLKTVTAQMAGMAKNLTKQIRGSKGQLEGIDQYTYDYIKKYGLDANIISDWIKNPDRSPALTNMMNQVLAANGLSSEEFRNSPNGASLLAEATNAAQMGAWEAIGEDKSQVIENWGARESRKEAHDVRMENMKFAHSAALKAMPDGSSGGGSGPGDGSLFPFQQGTLPIAVADGDIDKAVGKNAEAFGWEKNSKTPGGYMRREFLTIRNRFNTSGNKRYSLIQVPLYNSDGKVKNWKEFSAELQKALPTKDDHGHTLSESQRQELFNQGKQKFLGAVNAAKSLGLDTKNRYTLRDVDAALKKQRATGAAGYVYGYNWNHKNGDWNPMAQNMVVQEIDSVDHNGRLMLKSGIHTLSELLDTSTDAKINTNKGDVGAFITNKNGQKGVIFTVGNRQFYANYQTMANANTATGLAFKYLEEADKATRARDAALAAGNETEAYTAGVEASNYTSTAISLLDQGMASSISPENYKVWQTPTPTQNGLLK